MQPSVVASTRAAADAAETTARQNAITAEEAARCSRQYVDHQPGNDQHKLTATNTAYAAADANLRLKSLTP